MSKERDLMFDNIKGMMLFLVAFGHVLDVYCGPETNLPAYYVMKYIYLFHMPMFSFVTGYFSKNLDKSRENAVEKILIPYLFFQGVYIMVAAVMIRFGLATFNSNVFNYSIILPSSAFYYLLATFFWKLLAKDIMKLRLPIITSGILGLLISLTKYSDFHTGLGAVFSLLIFFVLGVECRETTIKKIRSVPHIISCVILLLGIIPAVYFPYAIHSVRLNYHDEGFSNVVGIGWRVVYYLIAIVMCTAMINLCPNKKTFFSRVGQKSILVYAGSTFLSPSAYVLIDHFVGISRSPILNTVCMVVFSALVIAFMTMDWIEKVYNFFIGIINHILFKKKLGNEKRG